VNAAREIFRWKCSIELKMRNPVSMNCATTGHFDPWRIGRRADVHRQQLPDQRKCDPGSEDLVLVRTLVLGVSVQPMVFEQGVAFSSRTGPLRLWRRPVCPELGGWLRPFLQLGGELFVEHAFFQIMLPDRTGA